MKYVIRRRSDTTYWNGKAWIADWRRANAALPFASKDQAQFYIRVWLTKHDFSHTDIIELQDEPIYVYADNTTDTGV